MELIEFKPPREYKRIKFSFRSGAGRMVITVLAASIATESVAPLLPSHDECDAITAALCVMPGLEPQNHHTTERDPIEGPIASRSYPGSGVSSMTANSFTGNFGQLFLVAGDGNDFKFTT